MNGVTASGLPRAAYVWCLTAGVIIGASYTLSPLTVCFAVALVPLFKWAGAGLSTDERKWLFAVLAVAVIARVATVAGLFVLTNHRHVPFGSLFGDEEYFIKRSLWLRNVALRLPISGADFIYAYDEYSRTGYLYVLGLLHILFGPSPYGVHLAGVLLYLVGALLLFRTVRPTFGRVASLAGLALLLFLPSLFAWSASALKEPLYFAIMSGLLAMVVGAQRSRRWTLRLLALVSAVVCAAVAQTIREGGLAMAAAGTLGGVALGVTIRRPRLVVAALVVGMVVLPMVLTRGRVEDRIVSSVRTAAQVQWGHVNTAGYVYTVLDPRFYEHRSSINTMTFREGAQFVAKGLITYVTVPAPWQIKSLPALSFLPEQMIWYGLVILFPLGLLAALRRDPFAASMLLMFALVAIVLVALTNGNVGTLVRHRGLALPYIVWFSALGACDLIVRLGKRTPVAKKSPAEAGLY